MINHGLLPISQLQGSLEKPQGLEQFTKAEGDVTISANYILRLTAERTASAYYSRPVIIARVQGMDQP